MIASSTLRAVLMSRSLRPVTLISLTSSASGTSFFLSARPSGVKNTCTFFLLSECLPLDEPELFHRRHSRECGWLHHARLFAQFALREAICFPKYAQKSPVSERYRVFSEPHLQSTDHRARGVLYEVREPIVRHGVVPVTQHFRGFAWRASHRFLLCHDVFPKPQM